MKFKVYKKNGNWFLQFDRKDFIKLLENAVKKYLEKAVYSFFEKNMLKLYYAEIALFIYICANIEVYYLNVFTT